jgi:hypothetical protein
MQSMETIMEPIMEISPAYAFASWALVFGVLMKWRFHEALDESTNNKGLFQWSSMFYRAGGVMMDFI